MVDDLIAHPNTGAQRTLRVDGTYKWWVGALDKAVPGNETASGDLVVRTFTVDTRKPGPPALVFPVVGGLLSNRTVAFSWDHSASGDIDQYRLQVTSGATFNPPLVLDVLIAHPNTGDQRTLPVDGTYKWRVGALDKAVPANETALGDLIVRNFTVDTTPPGIPTLVAPETADFLKTSKHFFDWNASTGDVAHYLLQVIKSSDTFQGPFVINTGDITETQFQATADLPDAAYRWRVIARDASLNTAASVSRTFAVDTIGPTKPANLTEATTGEELVRVFTWERSIELGFPDTGSGVDFYSVAITGPRKILTTADDSELLCPNDICRFSTPDLTPGSYTIQVKAVDRATNESLPASKDFCAGRTDVVQNLRVVEPAYVDPVTLGARVNTPNPKFRWNPPLFVPGGIKTYEVAITGDVTLPPESQFNIPFAPIPDTNFFTTKCFDGTGDAIGTGDQCTKALAAEDKIQITIKPNVPDGTHLLSVRVIPGVGVPEAPVDLTFTVDTVVNAPALISPASGAEVHPPIDLDWSDVIDPSQPVTYDLKVDDDITFGSPDVNEVGLVQSEFQIAAGVLLERITYHWRVTASDKLGNTATSEVRNFRVNPNDWTGTLTITGRVSATGAPVKANPEIFFGIRPFCADVFEFFQKPGGEGLGCDVPRGKLLPPTDIQAFFHNPGGLGDPVNPALLDSTLLEVSRFVPPTTVDVVQK